MPDDSMKRCINACYACAKLCDECATAACSRCAQACRRMASQHPRPERAPRIGVQICVLRARARHAKRKALRDALVSDTYRP